MLRNRSRTVTTSKQSPMADHNSAPSPRPNQTTPISSFFGSPRLYTRLYTGFFAKGVIGFESVMMSPTSILGSKKIPNFGNPFGCDQSQPGSPNKSKENEHFNEILDCKRIGLALIDSLNDEKNLDDFNPTTHPKSIRKVLFGSKLKIQIPINLSPSAISPTQSPKSAADFGIKTRNSSPFGVLNSGVQAKDSPKISAGGLSLREMELSEDYTCVISHGPNPKTTRIFDNCIVESCCGVVAVSDLKKEYNLNSPSQSFLSFCHTCKKNLGEGKDIYMYRGEKAFCSSECRCEEMFLDGMKNSEMDNGF